MQKEQPEKMTPRVHFQKSKLPAENMTTAETGRENINFLLNKEQKQSVRARTRKHKNAHIKKNASSGGENR